MLALRFNGILLADCVIERDLNDRAMALLGRADNACDARQLLAGNRINNEPSILKLLDGFIDSGSDLVKYSQHVMLHAVCKLNVAYASQRVELGALISETS